ncbi:MAG: pilus assembly protein TadG-related protein, partial [Solimonas sp.]
MPSPRAQRGAVAVFVAIALVALMVSLLLAIEIGRTYTAHRNLQKLANVAALDAARVLSGCDDPDKLTQKRLGDTVTASIARNGDPARLTAVIVEPGVIKSGAQSKRRYLEATPLWQGRAARVTLSAPFPRPLVPLLLGSSDNIATMTASATAQQEALGSFYLGTQLAGLHGGMLNSLLGALLCPPGTGGASCRQHILDIDLVGSTSGIAGVNVSLGNLLAGATKLGLNVRDLSDLLSIQLTLPQWLGVLGNGLEAALAETGNQASGGVSGLLQGLAGMSDPGRRFSLQEILNVSGQLLHPPLSGVLGALPIVNGQELLLALGQAAKANPDGSGSVVPITLPVNIGLGSLLNVNAFVQVLEPPKFALGRATGHPDSWNGAATYANCADGEYTCAQSSQIKVLVRAGINDKILGILKLRLGIDINVAAAAAYLDEVECPTASRPNPVAWISAVPAVATIAVGPYQGEPENAKNAPPILNIPGNPSENKPYLLQLFPDSGLLGWLFGWLEWLTGDPTTNVSLRRALVSNAGDSSFQSLRPVDDYQRTAATGAGKPTRYVAKGQEGLPASTDNPQTVKSSQLLTSLGSSLLSGLACGSMTGSCDLNAQPNLLVEGDKWNKNSLNLLSGVLKGLTQLLNQVVTPLLSGILGILQLVLSP